MPTWLSFEYHSAWRDVLVIALADLADIDDAMTLPQVFASIAQAKGQLKLGKLLFDLDESEIDAILVEKFEWIE